ncbi:hypothetical protein RRG08_032861 [Elysia crispata]|uniref:Secreted protein n=1 Tax=Elysia crispata TaxID=231223 RepID=A0AAE1DHN0_9GAST|nr:hypothetical protein RRG08_032861 [Elysia crispata]
MFLGFPILLFLGNARSRYSLFCGSQFFWKIIQTRDRACLDDNYGVIQFYLLQPRRAMMPLVLCFIGQGTQSA